MNLPKIANNFSSKKKIEQPHVKFHQKSSSFISPRIIKFFLRPEHLIVLLVVHQQTIHRRVSHNRSQKHPWLRNKNNKLQAVTHDRAECND